MKKLNKLTITDFLKEYLQERLTTSKLEKSKYLGFLSGIENGLGVPDPLHLAFTKLKNIDTWHSTAPFQILLMIRGLYVLSGRTYGDYSVVNVLTHVKSVLVIFEKESGRQQGFADLNKFKGNQIFTIIYLFLRNKEEGYLRGL
jgi:hypothetical protein